jgi:hypothetical protein
VITLTKFLKSHIFLIILIILWSDKNIYASDVDIKICAGAGYDTNASRSEVDPEDDAYLDFVKITAENGCKSSYNKAKSIYNQ